MPRLREPPVRPADRTGFVLVDALVAVAIVAAAGVTVYTIGSDVMRRQELELDRTVALATLQMLSKEIVVTKSAPRDSQDASFSYRVRQTTAPSVQPPLAVFTIEAVARDGGPALSTSLIAASR
jgi:hypothetical protein